MSDIVERMATAMRTIKPLTSSTRRANDNGIRNLDEFSAAGLAAIQPELRQVRKALQALFADMELRIDAETNLPEANLSGGYKDGDGSYVFPWGNSVHCGLHKAIANLNTLIGDANDQ